MHEFIVADVFHSIPTAVSSSSALSTAPTETRADPSQHIKFYISQLFFYFFYTDSAEHREYYPHIYSSLDAGFLFRICSLHARPCLLPPEVKVPPSHSYLLCMCSISIDSPFYAKSAVNTRQVARLVLFMNMCPWRHPLSSGFFFFPQSPSVGSGRGVLESQTVFTV